MDLVTRIQHRLSPMDPIPTGARADIRPLPDIRAVLFDVYGTLFTSGSGDIGVAGAADNAMALRDSLREAGLPADAAQVADWVAAVKASHAAAHARGITYPEIEVRDIWRQVVNAPATKEQIDVLAVEYECRVNPVWPMPGLAETLACLQDRGLALGIVSNAQFYTPLMIEACLGAPPTELGFPEALCSWSYRLGEAKPSPHMFAPILEELHRRGLAPRQAVYLGNDMLNDIWTASRAGLHTCLFAGDQRSLRLRSADPRCQSLLPDRTITTLPQKRSVLGF